MVSFGILLFFAVTGLTLNHAEMFAGEQRTIQSKGTLNTTWTKGSTVAKLEIVEQLRKAHGIKGALSDFRIDDQQLNVSFKGPGYAADTFIDRATGKYDLTETRSGLVAIMNDLHKGRDTGHGWSIMIDVSAILMTAVSITGIALIFFLQKRRRSGLLIAAIGLIACYAVYAIWVP